MMGMTELKQTITIIINMQFVITIIIIIIINIKMKLEQIVPSVYFCDGLKLKLKG